MYLFIKIISWVVFSSRAWYMSREVIRSPVEYCFHLWQVISFPHLPSIPSLSDIKVVCKEPFTCWTLELMNCRVEVKLNTFKFLVMSEEWLMKYQIFGTVSSITDLTLIDYGQSTLIFGAWSVGLCHLVSQSDYRTTQCHPVIPMVFYKGSDCSSANSPDYFGFGNHTWQTIGQSVILL